MRSLAAVVLLSLVGACSIQSNLRPTPARIQIIVEPDTARVSIDGHRARRAAIYDARPAEVRPGPHRISVEAPGYFPHDVEVEAVPGTTTVRLSLREIPE